MLIVSRKVSESIMIGDDIEVIITDIGSERVKIGIRAPKGIPVLRKELLETQNLNREASDSVGSEAFEALNVYLNEINKETAGEN